MHRLITGARECGYPTPCLDGCTHTILRQLCQHFLQVLQTQEIYRKFVKLCAMGSNTILLALIAVSLRRPVSCSFDGRMIDSIICPEIKRFHLTSHTMPEATQATNSFTVERCCLQTAAVLQSRMFSVCTKDVLTQTSKHK